MRIISKSFEVSARKITQSCKDPQGILKTLRRTMKNTQELFFDHLNLKRNTTQTAVTNIIYNLVINVHFCGCHCWSRRNFKKMTSQNYYFRVSRMSLKNTCESSWSARVFKIARLLVSIYQSEESYFKLSALWHQKSLTANSSLQTRLCSTMNDRGKHWQQKCPDNTYFSVLFSHCFLLELMLLPSNALR